MNTRRLRPAVRSYALPTLAVAAAAGLLIAPNADAQPRHPPHTAGVPVRVHPVPPTPPPDAGAPVNPAPTPPRPPPPPPNNDIVDGGLGKVSAKPVRLGE